MKREKFGKQRDRREHISPIEIKRNFLMTVLFGFLIFIIVIIVIVMIPKGSNKQVQNSSQTTKKNLVIESNSNNNEDKIDRDPSKVTITVDQDSLTEDGAMITITDTNDIPYKWTAGYKLEEKVDGKWVEMQLTSPQNAIFASDEKDNPTGTMNQSLVWLNKYGKLEPGKEYRIVKESDGQEFYAEFQLD